jgi:hypothetical protein
VGQFQTWRRKRGVRAKALVAQRKHAKLLSAACSLPLLLCATSAFARDSFLIDIHRNFKLNHYLVLERRVRRVAWSDSLSFTLARV